MLPPAWALPRPTFMGRGAPLGPKKPCRAHPPLTWLGSCSVPHPTMMSSCPRSLPGPGRPGTALASPARGMLGGEPSPPHSRLAGDPLGQTPLPLFPLPRLADPACGLRSTRKGMFCCRLNQRHHLQDGTLPNPTAVGGAPGEGWASRGAQQRTEGTQPPTRDWAQLPSPKGPPRPPRTVLPAHRKAGTGGPSRPLFGNLFQPQNPGRETDSSPGCRGLPLASDCPCLSLQSYLLRT